MSTATERPHLPRTVSVRYSAGPGTHLHGLVDYCRYIDNELLFRFHSSGCFQAASRYLLPRQHSIELPPKWSLSVSPEWPGTAAHSKLR